MKESLLKLIPTLGVCLSISLTACVTDSASFSHEDPVKFACKTFAQEQGHPKEWISKCEGDTLTFRNAYKLNLMNKDPITLCSIKKRAEKDDLYLEIEKERKINCKSIMDAYSKQVVSTSNAEDLCLAWYQRSQDAALNELIDKEVKKRNLNCVSVVSIMQQHMDAQNALEESKASRRAAAFSALQSLQAQNALVSSMNRPRTCYGSYNSATCH